MLLMPDSTSQPEIVPFQSEQLRRLCGYQYMQHVCFDYLDLKLQVMIVTSRSISSAFTESVDFICAQHTSGNTTATFFWVFSGVLLAFFFVSYVYNCGIFGFVFF